MSGWILALCCRLRFRTTRPTTSCSSTTCLKRPMRWCCPCCSTSEFAVSSPFHRLCLLSLPVCVCVYLPRRCVRRQVSRLQRGASRPRETRHRLRGVWKRHAGGRRQRRAAGLQDHGDLRHEDHLRQEVVPGFDPGTLRDSKSASRTDAPWISVVRPDSLLIFVNPAEPFFVVVVFSFSLAVLFVKVGWMISGLQLIL